ncbi:MAG: hypothetical protein WBP12_04330 [Candidatus Saccharimonas sp.]
MSRRKTYIIYLSGLGDRYDSIRGACLWGWRIYGATVTLVPSRWASSETFDVKVKRVMQVVQEAHDNGYRVVLIGESAGGSLALNIYAQVPTLISRVVTLCGKNAQADTVSPRLYRRNPAFRVSMQRVGRAVEQLTRDQRQRVSVVYPLVDAYVPRADTLIPDCHRVRLYSVGHLTSILFGLTFASFVLVREARR